MFRAAVMGIALLCAVGPSVGLVCKAWCDPRAAAQNGCHHEDDRGIASVRSDRSCDDAVQAPASFLTEDLRRAPAPSDATAAVATRLLVIEPAAHGAPTWARGRPPSHLKRPQTTPLRI